MKIDERLKKEILIKKSKLNNVKDILKQEFIGIDYVIDEIVSMIENWYLFPNLQEKPTIINLWGITGTGKTSLVLRLMELLEHKNVISFDIGEYSGNENSYSIKDDISQNLRKIDKDDNIPVLIFDEFQLGKTKDAINEYERSGLRPIWELFDTGKLAIDYDNWLVTDFYIIYNKLNELIDKYDIKVKNNIITDKKYYDIYFKLFPDLKEYIKSEKSKKKKSNIKEKNLTFFPYNHLHDLYKIWSDKYLTIDRLEEYLNSLDNEKSVLDFVKETIQHSFVDIVYDFKKSLFFVIGNLDDSYGVYGNMNPDIDADTLYESIKDVNLTNIKNSLSKIYRPEQVSRLGNNHIIYKTLKKSQYYKLIDLKLKNIINKYKNEFKLNINISDNIKDIIYKEGVLPAQGIRPLLSTIDLIVKINITKIIADLLKNNISINDIFISYKNKKLIAKYNDSILNEYDLILKINTLREGIKNDEQAMVSVHETGHVLASLYKLKLLPNKVMSQTASQSNGTTYVDMPDFLNKEVLYNRIIMLLSGHAAEKYFFGKNCISTGSVSDFKEATLIAVDMVKIYGMFSLKGIYKHDSYNNNDDIALDLNNDKSNIIARKIINSAYKDAEKLIKDKEKILKYLSRQLFNNGTLTGNEILTLVNKYENLDLKDKDNYYNYKNILYTK